MEYSIEVRCEKCGKYYQRGRSHVCRIGSADDFRPIGNKLTDCANYRCNRCEFKKKSQYPTCQTLLIQKMAEEIKRVVNETEDDGK